MMWEHSVPTIVMLTRIFEGRVSNPHYLYEIIVVNALS
jgi:hypothetical protein